MDSEKTASVNVIPLLNDRIPITNYTAGELLDALSAADSASQVLVRGRKRDILLVCLIPTHEESLWAIKDAEVHLDKILRGQSQPRSTGFLFTAKSGVNWIATISSFVQQSAKVSINYEEDVCEDDNESSPPRSWYSSLLYRTYQPVPIEEDLQRAPASLAKRRMIRYLTVTLLVFLVFAVIAASLPSPGPPWQRFSEIDGSIGPQYQPQLLSENVTAWAAKQQDMASRWFLRIDDGAIFPRKLLIDKEIEYQDWLHQRYPEVDAVQRSGRYLDPEYLAHPDIFDMLVDKYFHISHCVHSMRRYWVAKETGHHICPMDLSHDHMNHCFEDILLPWALPSGPRGTTPDNFTDVPTYNISWITRVCF